MDNDKLFAAYAITLIAGVASVITTSIATGMAALPEAGVFLEHVVLSLALRGTYKSFGGFDWLYSFGRSAGFITVRDAVQDAVPSSGFEHANA